MNVRENSFSFRQFTNKNKTARVLFVCDLFLRFDFFVQNSYTEQLF